MLLATTTIFTLVFLTKSLFTHKDYLRQDLEPTDLEPNDLYIYTGENVSPTKCTEHGIFYCFLQWPEIIC